PKACAQHYSIFLVANDIFRTVLKQAERNECVKDFLQTFTKCFLRELSQQQPQTSASLKAFFPQSPPSLLVPLLTMPSEMPQEVSKNHLMWVSSSLQRLTEEEEEEEDDSDSRNIRGPHKVFEAWFLLLQCGHWVQMAVQLLVTSGPEDCGPLLWLLVFYHHPTNRWHHRASQLVVDQFGLQDEATRVLSSLRLRLNDRGCFANDRVRLRIEELHKTIKQM
ncbi:hypothetical protein ILYODFUR_013680, partial [Ilyodon furcidens]